jgi:hypothetical protein
MLRCSSPGYARTQRTARNAAAPAGWAFVVGATARLEAHLTLANVASRGVLGDMVAKMMLGHLDRTRHKRKKTKCSELQNVKISLAFGIAGAFGAGCSARLMIGGGGSTA